MVNAVAPPVGSHRDPVGLYLREIGGCTLLDRDEEARLGQAIQEGLRAQRRLAGELEIDGPERARLDDVADRGQSARQRFVEANLRLVVFVAKGYRHHGVDLLDLIQEGNLGLIQAVERFDWQRGLRFSTYATWWIRQAVLRGLGDKKGLIRLPGHAHDQMTALFRARDRLRPQLLREPTFSEMAAEAGVAPLRAAQVLRAGNDHASLFAPVGEGTAELIDLVVDEGASAAFDAAVEEDSNEQIRGLLGRLDRRAGTILELHFGLNGCEPHTLDEVSRRVGVSRERVRQIEQRSLTRLRHQEATRAAGFAAAG